MDDFKEKIIIANNEIDFITNSNSNISATYFIVLNNETPEDEKIYKASICGLSLAEWVAMACDIKPIFLSAQNEKNILELLKPYVNNSEYMVVLYANTPLLTKTHLKDLLNFVVRKRFNACKLKKGYILRSDFVLDADAIYSNFAYDLATNDFFEVDSIFDLETVRTSLEKRMFNYHINKGVSFKNPNTTNIDASVKIGTDSKISGAVTIENNSTIGENVEILANSVIINSKIGNNCKIGTGVIIENSVVKNRTEILSGANINHSVIGENVKIENNVKVVDSAVGNDSNIKSFSNISSANINTLVNVGKFSNIAGVNVVVSVDENSSIPAFSNVVKYDK